MTRLVIAFLIASAAWAQRLDVWGNAASTEVGFAPGSIVVLSPGGVFSGQHSISMTMQSQGSTQAVACQLLSGAPPPYYWVVVPETMPPGATTVTMVVDGGFTASGRITIVPTAPALFAVRPWGVGPALAQNIGPDTTPSLNQLTNPALPGQFITLWATGLGSATTADITVDVAGTSVSASFAGHAPGLPGVDQINFQLPPNSYTGCYVPVTAHAGTVASNPLTLAINATPGACAHPLGLTHADLQTLDGGGRIQVGSILLPQGEPALQQQPLWEQGLSLGVGRPSALFTMLDAEQVFFLSQPQAPLSVGCVGPFLSVGVGFTMANLDAGPQMTLFGPGGVTLGMPLSGGYYEAVAAVLIPGAWQISAPGGKDIRGFQQSLTMPPLPLLSSASKDPSSGDVVIEWDPRGYSASDVMTVSLGTGNVTDSAAAICTAPATAGQAVVPGNLLNAPGAPASESALLTVSQASAARVFFSVPLVTGGTIPTVIGYSLSHVQPITLQ